VSDKLQFVGGLLLALENPRQTEVCRTLLEDLNREH